MRHQPLEPELDLAVRGENRPVELDHRLGDGRHALHRQQAVRHEPEGGGEVPERPPPGPGRCSPRPGSAPCVPRAVSCGPRSGTGGFVPLRGTLSEPEHQPVAERPGDAHHQAAVRGPVGLAQHVVPVVDLALDHLDLAAPADPLPAVAEHLDARLLEHVEERAARRHQQPAPGLGEDELDRVPARRVALDHGRREPLAAKGAGPPAGHPLLDRGQQRAGAARVDERVRPRPPQERVEVGQPARVLRPARHPVAVRRELAGERHRPGRAACVEQPPVHAGGVGRRGHGQQRGDADPAGHEQVSGGRLQPEVVARPGVLDLVAGAEHVVDVGGPAATRLLPEHAEAVAEPVRRVPAERVLARHRARQPQVEVGAGLPRRELRAVRVEELNRHDAGRLLGEGTHHQHGHGLQRVGRGGRPGRHVPRTRTPGSRPAERPLLWAGPGTATLCAMVQPATGRALVLDIGGVVLRNARELIRSRAAIDAPAVTAYAEAVDFAGPGDELWQRMLRHDVTEREYWAQRADEIGRVLGRGGWTTFDLITWLYERPESEWLAEEVVALMADTKAAGLPLVALTNDLADFHGQTWADEQEWLEPFDTIVDGSVTGVLKPDPAAYELAISAVGLPAAEIVYLDDMPVNVAGGAAAGLQAIEVVHEDKGAAVAEARRRLGLDVPTEEE